jgi:hypothetical protein
MSSRHALPLLARSLRGLSLWCAVALTLGACRKDEGGVTISGDVAGLDTIGLRGDQLIANAGKLPTTEDSLRAVASGQVNRPHNAGSAKAGTAAALPSLPGVNPMSARAQARGDSMAKAAAMRLVAGNAGGTTRGDTLRGVVTVLGADAGRQVVLRTAAGTMISLSGMVTSGFARMAGTELVVRGVKVSPRDIVVTDYLVRASNGVPAFDGKLAGGAASGWWLQLTDGSGKKRLASLPPPLQGLEGTRIWIAFKPGTSVPQTYGVIGRR